MKRHQSALSIDRHRLPVVKIVVLRRNSKGEAVEGTLCRLAPMEVIQKSTVSVTSAGPAPPLNPTLTEAEKVQIDSVKEVKESDKVSEKQDLTIMDQNILDAEAGLNREVDPLPPYLTVGDYKNELNIPVSTEAALHFGYAFGLHAKSLRKTDKSSALSIVEKKWLQSFPDDRLFTWNNLTVKNFLGKGSYGTVYSAELKNETVALKQFKQEARVSEIWRERDMLIFLRNKRVVNMMGAFYDRGAYIVMEHCYGSVSHMVKCISDRQKLRYTIHLLEGLRFIHSKGIIHCDVRPDNCLITKRNTLVLADFGNAQVLQDGKEFVRAKDKMLSHPGFSDFNSCVGGIYSKSSDIFGAACCIYLMEKAKNLCLYDVGHVKEKDAIAEYGRVAREGRLVRGPGEPGYDENGERTPLFKIAQHSRYFPILKDMLDDRYTRVSAEELLKNPLFEQLKKELNVTDDNIDSDKEPVYLYDKVDLTKRFYPYENNPALAFTLQMLYYDQDKDQNVKERNLEKLPTEEPVPTPAVTAPPLNQSMEFQAVALDMIQEKLEKFLLEHSVKVVAARTEIAPHATAQDETVSSMIDSTVCSKISLDGILDPNGCPVIPVSNEASRMVPPEPKKQVGKAPASPKIATIMASPAEMAPPPNPSRPPTRQQKRKARCSDKEICSPTMPVQKNIHGHKTARDGSMPNKKARTEESPPPKEIDKGVGGKKKVPVVKKVKSDQGKETLKPTPIQKPVKKSPAARPCFKNGPKKTGKTAQPSAIITNKTPGPACSKLSTEMPAPKSKVTTSSKPPPKMAAKVIAAAKNCDQPNEGAPKEAPVHKKPKSYRCIPECSFISKDSAAVMAHKQQCAIWWKIKGEPRQKDMEQKQKEAEPQPGSSNMKA